MKIARFHEHGPASVIRYDDIERPEPRPGEVLVEVAATSFNPTEAALRAGALREITPVALPYALGWDVAGTVGGERVIGWLDGGAAAEYVAAPADLLVPAPATIPLADAAALPLAGLTAWQAVFEHAVVKSGQRVLVNGAGGGIGGFAVQLAKHAGAEVVATASPRSADRVRRLGADEILDYTTTSLREATGIDVVLNFATIDEPLTAGTVVSAAGRLPAPAKHFVTRRDTAQLAELVRLVDAGAVRVEVTESHPLTGIRDLHRRAEAGDTHGKVTIIPESAY